MTDNLMESMVRQRLGGKGARSTARTVWPRTSSKIPRKFGPPWPNRRAGRPSSPVAALVAAQVSATAGSRERDGGDLVLGEARWRKENGFLGPLANPGARRYSSAASVPSLTGAGGSKRAPRAFTPHPGASSCLASSLLESRRVGWDRLVAHRPSPPTRASRPKRKKHP